MGPHTSVDIKVFRVIRIGRELPVDDTFIKLNSEVPVGKNSILTLVTDRIRLSPGVVFRLGGRIFSTQDFLVGVGTHTSG